MADVSLVVQLQRLAVRMDPSRSEVSAAITTAVAHVIDSEMRRALADARALQADIFVFGEAFHRRYPRWWCQV